MRHGIFFCRSIRSAAVPLVLLGAGVGAAEAASDMVISQVYGGGGNTGAPYSNDFVELFNRGTTPANLAGWSLQYASATGTGNLGASATQLTELPSLTLQPGQYLLVQEAPGAAATAPLPTPDVVDPTPIAMSGTAGKVALVRSSTSLGCNGGSTACSPAQLALIVDLVGYGGTNFFETAPTAVLSNSTAALRAGAGCTDTDVNNADFAVGAPLPRNGATALNACTVVNAPVLASCPATLPVVAGVGGAAAVSARDADGTVTSAMITSAAVPGISLQGIVPGSTLTAQLAVDASVLVGNYAVDLWFTNSGCPGAERWLHGGRQRRAGGGRRAHPRHPGRRAPVAAAGSGVSSVPGIVTASATTASTCRIRHRTPTPPTSEGIFVFTTAAPPWRVGDAVRVTGTVKEFRAGGAGGHTNLTITEIVGPTVDAGRPGNPLPAPTVIGTGARPVRPVIEDDATRRRRDQRRFDPAQDGIDFYESLEGDARPGRTTRSRSGRPTTSARSRWSATTARMPACARRAGASSSGADDFNPERIILDDTLDAAVPARQRRRPLPRPVVGVIDYSFGNFKLDVLTTPTGSAGGLDARTRQPRQRADAAGRRHLQRREPEPDATRRRSSPRWRT